ncbi:EAL domain-containing protein [Castellaniella sp.]|uniref:bifunctional diguanylate cyclase/phosphodiesterase n=1 Tax=Castellaniella sp. TaxID=1955812 RepID=UPI002AFE792E|nr:EAL domain-containing protein [Castellaniella sp.]
MADARGHSVEPNSDPGTRPGFFDSLRTRLFLAVLVAAIPIIIGMGYYIWHQYKGLVANAEHSAESLVQITVAYDRTLLDDARDVLLALSNSPVLRDGRWDQCRGYLATLLSRLPRYLNLGVASAEGYQVCSGLPDPNPNGAYLGDRPYIQAAMEQPDVVLGGFIIGRMSNIPTLVLGVRISGDSGVTSGVVFAGLNLGYLRAGAAIPDLQPRSRLWILDREGHVLQRIPGDISHLGERVDPYPPGGVGLLRSTYLDASGEPWVSFTMPSGPRGDPLGISVRYEIPETSLYAEARSALWTGLVIMALLLGVVMLVAWNLTQLAAGRSLEYLREAVRRLAAQDFSWRVADRLHGRDLREIGQQFDAMADALQSTQRHLQQSEQSYRLLFEGSPNPMLVMGTDSGRFLAVNDAALLQYGYDREALLALTLDDLRVAVLDNQSGSSYFYEHHRHHDGHVLLVEVRSLFLRFTEQSAHVLVIRDLTEHHAQQQALAYQASHDPLTQLLNRGEILDQLQRRTQQTSDQGWALVLSNLDGFKEVNGALGHDVGDRMLQAVATRFRDTLGADCVLARLGGDEFAFLLETNHEVQARGRVYRLLAAIREPFSFNEMQLRINCSFGLALYPDHTREPDELVRFADAAMRRAKREGLGIAVFNAQDRTHVHDRLLLRAELRTALAQGQFLLHLQPKIILNSDHYAEGTPVGFEALARWSHPERGLIPPAQFIPIIEITDLIHPFTRWVVDQAVAACVRLQAVYPGVGIAVNISARNLLDEYFPQQVEDVLIHHGLDPSLLELEVTESVIMADPARALRTLYALHGLGVRLSIDDFGTGYSSFAYLNRLPVDALKIDQSFVAGMVEDADLAAIVRSIIDMSHTLGLKVIAEGIETAAVQQQLRDMGCDMGQGYGIGRPMPADQALAWLRDAGSVHS